MGTDRSKGGRYRRRNFRDLQIVGKTDNGYRVVAGLFPLVNSEGIALDILIHGLWQRGYVPDWINFLREAQAYGWNLGTTKARIVQAVSDVHGRPWCDHMELRLEQVLRELLSTSCNNM